MLFISILQSNYSKGILFYLFLERKGKVVWIEFLLVTDWVVVTEDNHVDNIPKGNFDKIITLED
jgi:hypothetical protein